MRTFFSILSFMFLTVFSFSTFAQSQIQNPGFEAGEFKANDTGVLPGWKVRLYETEGEVIYSLDTEAPHSGKRSFKIEIPSVRQRVARLQPTQIYPVPMGSRATISFYYRAKSGGSGAESAMWITLYDADRKEMATSSGKRTRLAFTDKWKQETVVFPVPDDDPRGYHLALQFRHINPGTFSIDDIELNVTPGVGLFDDKAQNVTPPTGQPAAEELAAMNFKPWFNEGGFQCQKTDSDIVKVTTGDKNLLIRGRDGAVISNLSSGGTHYPGHGQGGLFRDLFWIPEEARWSKDATDQYEVGECTVGEDGKLNIEFKRTLTQAPLTGLQLSKTFVMEPGLRQLSAEIRITNPGKESVEFRYWSWHRLDVPSKDASFHAQGDPVFNAGAGAPPQIYFKPHFSQWVKVSDRHYFGWDRSLPSRNGVFLDRLQVWNAPDFPALGLVGKPIDLAGGKTFQARILYNAITEKIAIPGQARADFQLIHPYGVKKKLAYRASIHNHSQYHPGYTHAPMPTGTLLTYYRDHKCSPPYKIVSITEHSRLTLPQNTDPLGEINPPWGVEGMLFIPGGELTIGNTRTPVSAGDLFAEINCVGLPTDNEDHSKQNNYYHRQVSYLEAGKYLKHLIDGGIYVGMCHPNCQLDGEGVQRWPTSGYNRDELDIIFGNPEKCLPGLEQVPLGLEIGNQGYDFTARTNFINAEGVWDMLLTRGHRLMGTCSDDTHGRPACGGWIVPFMDEMTQEEFMKSLLSGNFYASQGPEITSIDVAGRTFRVATNQPSLIEFIGREGKVLQAFPDSLQGEYNVQGHEIYVRARVTRECPELSRSVGGGIGHRRSAWTNPIYLQ